MNTQTRRNFLRNAGLLSGGLSLTNALPAAIQKAFSIDPTNGSTFEDAEHIVLLMQENRSFDHCFGTLNGVRGYNDPRAITLPNGDPVWLQTNKKGETYLPFRLNMDKSKITWMGGLPHSWTDQVDARNGGKYDNWLNAKLAGYPGFKEKPMTMGHYTREDLPFNYALADAFTVCDHHFCASLTGTTPNRLYFFSGALRKDGSAENPALVQNEYVDYDKEVDWYTVPEMLEDNGISWRIYQNELSYQSGLKGNEDPWLGNFTDNPIEWFKQFHIRRQQRYIGIVKKLIKENDSYLLELKGKAKTNPEDKKTINNIKQSEDYKKWLEAELDKIQSELSTPISKRSESLLNNAFSINNNDPEFHQIETVKYDDNSTEREITVPKSDILSRFRNDVHSGQLPAVSWLVAPENFSDHPASPWYGSWYVSEVLDILTQNPEVWKKTVFILTYDENDGYFDHMPPFVAPDSNDASTGMVSKSIKQVAAEYVTKEDEAKKGVKPSRVRVSPIGLGYRVPFVVASPWSRGGYVNSEIFDHTSVVQFIESFASRKKGKKIQCPNVTDWRRAVCGDLSSIFRPYNGERLEEPQYLKRNDYVQRIDKAQYQPLPEVMAALVSSEIETIKKDKTVLKKYLQQEKGSRKANAIPYELQVDATNKEDDTLQLDFNSYKKLFKTKSAGVPFTVYALTKYNSGKGFESGRNWNFTVAAGDQLSYSWPIAGFENGIYQLAVHGPNGFYRFFTGNKSDSKLDIQVIPNILKGKKYGAISLLIENKEDKAYSIKIKDNAYGKSQLEKTIAAHSNIHIDMPLENSFGWYDFTISLNGHNAFIRTYAGHVENGKESMSDPQLEL